MIHRHKAKVDQYNKYLSDGCLINISHCCTVVIFKCLFSKDSAISGIEYLSDGCRVNIGPYCRFENGIELKLTITETKYLSHFLFHWWPLL